MHSAGPKARRRNLTDPKPLGRRNLIGLKPLRRRNLIGLSLSYIILGYFIAVPYAARRHTLVSLAIGDSLGSLPPISAIVINIYFASWRIGSRGT